MGMSRRSLFWSKVGGTDSNGSRVGAATGEGALWQLSGSFPEAGQQVFAKQGCRRNVQTTFGDFRHEKASSY